MPAKKTKKSRTRTTVKLYFMLITITGVIGTLITLGILIFAVAQKVIITDQEYIIAERYYELDVCSQKTNQPNPEYRVPSGYYGAEVGTNYGEPTQSEIEKCEAEKTQQLIDSRQASFKMDLLSGAIRAILFLILLFTHYPRFMKINKKD